MSRTRRRARNSRNGSTFGEKTTEHAVAGVSEYDDSAAVEESGIVTESIGPERSGQKHARLEEKHGLSTERIAAMNPNWKQTKRGERNSKPASTILMTGASVSPGPPGVAQPGTRIDRPDRLDQIYLVTKTYMMLTIESEV